MTRDANKRQSELRDVRTMSTKEISEEIRQIHKELRMTDDQEKQAIELLWECYSALTGHRTAPSLADRVAQFANRFSQDEEG